MLIAGAVALTPVFRTGLGHIDGQCAAIQLLAIQIGDCSLSLRLGRHFHKAKSLGLAAEPVLDNVCSRDLSMALKCLTKIAYRGLM